MIEIERKGRRSGPRPTSPATTATPTSGMRPVPTVFGGSRMRLSALPPRPPPPGAAATTPAAASAVSVSVPSTPALHVGWEPHTAERSRQVPPPAVHVLHPLRAVLRPLDAEHFCHQATELAGGGPGERAGMDWKGRHLRGGPRGGEMGGWGRLRKRLGAVTVGGDFFWGGGFKPRFVGPKSTKITSVFHLEPVFFRTP